METSAILRIDMEFYMGAICWALRKSLCGIHVLWAYQSILTRSSEGYLEAHGSCNQAITVVTNHFSRPSTRVGQIITGL